MPGSHRQPESERTMRGQAVRSLIGIVSVQDVADALGLEKQTVYNRSWPFQWYKDPQGRGLYARSEDVREYLLSNPVGSRSIDDIADRMAALDRRRTHSKRHQRKQQ